MNRLIYFTLIFLAALATGCSKADELLYHDIARVQMNDTATVNSTFVYAPATVTRDTVYIQVNTIGDMASYDREVTLVQVPESGTVNAAVPGLHYVAMDDPALKSLMVVKANTVKAMIPVVLLRDASLKDKSYRLKLQLSGNDQFGLGEIQRRSCVIVFSDRLERFYSWRVDSGTAPAFYTLGKYSTRKHQFIVDVLKEQIDEAWYQTAVSIGALQNYGNLLKTALDAFNKNADNIASGAAPLRETADPASALITFP
jgi:hypothetical protein